MIEMKRLLIGLAISAYLISPLQAQQTRAQLSTYNNSYITSNGHGAITGPILNTFNGNLINSVCTLLDAGNCTSTALSYTNPATGGMLETVQGVLQRTISTADFGDSASAASTTCTTSASSARVTLGGANDFAVGEGVNCFGAGATYSLSAPTGF